jgi:cell wall-active antibiotic response 4TMS protein YvqF
MNDRSVLTPRLIFGLVILTLGLLWTLDNLGLVNASEITRWWPLAAITWGVLRLQGIAGRRNGVVGTFWLVVGSISLLHTLGYTSITIFVLWPLFLILLGASLVFRAWRGTSWVSSGAEPSSRLNTFAFLAAAVRKVVAQDFRGGDVSAVLAGASVDLRSAQLADGRAVIDVFAMWGGIEILVPAGWRVVGEVTAVAGGFQDSTPPPADPNAPTLVVRGWVLMGGIDVKSESNWRMSGASIDPATGERVPPGVVITRGKGKPDVHVSLGGGFRRGPGDADARAAGGGSGTGDQASTEPDDSRRGFAGFSAGKVTIGHGGVEIRGRNAEIRVAPGSIEIVRGSEPGAGPDPGPASPAPGPASEPTSDPRAGSGAEPIEPE